MEKDKSAEISKINFFGEKEYIMLYCITTVKIENTRGVYFNI